ncbi:MAG: non-ribosomal peptide synthetase, partial [Mycobacterium sp.]
GSAYNMPSAVRLEGELDGVALERALAEIVRRHEALRTRFAVAEGVGWQVIDAAGAFRLERVDLSGQPEEEREAEARRLTALEATQRFDLATGPLLRAKLLRLGVREHVVLVTLHHIVSDGWSMGVLVEELVSLYGAYVRGENSPLAELAVQYADYALWQRSWLQGEVLERQVGYWRNRLSGAPAALELPTDRPRPAVASHAGGSVPVRLPAVLKDRLMELGRREGATLYMVLLAAYQALLKAYSGQDDIVVGSPIAGRRRQELEGLIGFFVNTLVLRTDLSGDPTFRELLGRVKETALGAYAHQDLPFEKLVEELRPVRDLSRQPVFQAVLALQNAPMGALEAPGLTLRPAGGAQVTSQFDLSLFVWETADGLQGYLEYATDLFERSTIERLSGHLEVLLDGIVADPGRRLSALPVLGAAERRLVVEEWNATQAAYPAERCVHELFAEQAARTPDAVAVVFEDDRLTYGELEARSNQLAHHLRELGVGCETIVALCVERSLEMVVGLLGILKAGGTYLPLDPDYPAERLAYMLGDAGVRVLLTQAGLAGRLPATAVPVVLLDGDAATIGCHPTTAPASLTAPDNLAYVIYTSGSTGKPKGVMVQHCTVVNLLASMAVSPGINSRDVLAAVTPLSFDIAGLELYLPLLWGARLVVLPRSIAQDGGTLRVRLEEIGATILQATPSTWRLLQDAGWSDATVKVLCGGEAVPADLASSLAERGASAWNLYGPTETTIWSALCPLKAGERVSIGRPIWNTQLYVLDEVLEPVPIGVRGELYIGGAGLARG